MEYKTIMVREKLEKFNRQVKEMIEAGWSLQGGVSIASHSFDNTIMYAQSFVKGKQIRRGNIQNINAPNNTNNINIG